MDINALKQTAQYFDSLYIKSQSLFSGNRERTLLLDLEKKTSQVFEIKSSLIESYVSGPALAMRLFLEYADEKDTNPVVITAPAAGSGRISAIAFVSPQSNKLCINTIEGPLGSKIKLCGYRAIVIKGKSEQLSSVQINFSNPVFENCPNLAGKTTTETEKQLKITPSFSCISIGLAGENKISYACCVCDGYSTGRGGLGKVFGLKNLKAISIQGSVSKDRMQCNFRYIQDAGKYGWAPVDNFENRTDPRLFHLSEKEFTKNFDKELYTLPLPNQNEILMLGSNTGCYNTSRVVKRFQKCIELGLDPVSAGNIMGFSKPGVSDEAFFTDIAQNEFIGSNYKINGIEIGACDYRGNYVQALTDACSYWFTNIFCAIGQLCTVLTQSFAIHGQNIEMGLESFGLDCHALEKKLRNTNCIFILAMKASPFLSKYLVRPTAEVKTLSKEFKTKLECSQITELGKKCRAMFDAINMVLNPNSECTIPDHFCIDCDSNYPRQTVVPFRKLSNK